MSGGGPQPPFTRQFSASSASKGVFENGGQPNAVNLQQQQPASQQEQSSLTHMGGHYYPPPPPQSFTGSSDMGGSGGYPAAPGGVYAVPAPGGGPFMMAAYPMGAYGPNSGMVPSIMGNVLPPTMTGQQQQPPQQGGPGFNPRGMQQHRPPHNRRGGMPGNSKQQIVHFDESSAATETVDRAIVSALKQPQHRRLLLEVEPAIKRMITETDSERLKLTNPLGKYQRMLIHKLGDYYRMDREVDYTKGSEMSTVTLIRTERTCVPNTILQELCRTALEAAEMADGSGHSWPYVSRQQQESGHRQQQEQYDVHGGPPHDDTRARSDEGVLEQQGMEHCADERGTCSEGGASGGGTPSETAEDPTAATGIIPTKGRSVKILRRGPGSKGKNMRGATRGAEDEESSSDEGGKHSEANLLHNFPVDQREEHYNKIRAKIFQEDDGTPLVCSNEELAAMEGARKHIPKGTDLDDPDYNRQAVSIIPQLGRVQQAPPTLMSDPAAYNAEFPALGGGVGGGYDDEDRNKEGRRRGGNNKRQQQQFQQQQQPYTGNTMYPRGIPVSPMMQFSHGPGVSGGAATTTADAATIAAFQQGYIAATMAAAAAAAQQQGVAWNPPPPHPMNFPSPSSQQQQDSLLPNPGGTAPTKFPGHYQQPSGMPLGTTGGHSEGTQQQQQWGGAVPSPRKGARGGSYHVGSRGGRGNRGGRGASTAAAAASSHHHHQQGGRQSYDDMTGSLVPLGDHGWGHQQQNRQQQQQQGQQPQSDVLLLRQQQEQLTRVLERQSGLHTTQDTQRGDGEAKEAPQVNDADRHSPSLAEGPSTTHIVDGGGGDSTL